MGLVDGLDDGLAGGLDAVGDAGREPEPEPPAVAPPGCEGCSGSSVGSGSDSEISETSISWAPDGVPTPEGPPAPEPPGCSGSDSVSDSIFALLGSFGFGLVCKNILRSQPRPHTKKT